MFVGTYKGHQASAADAFVAHILSVALLLSPGASLGVIAMVMFDQTVHPRSASEHADVRVVSFVCAIASMLLCIALTYYSDAFWHLQVLLLLYVVFTIWDHWISSRSAVPEARREAKRSLIYLNIPTICALFILLVVYKVLDHACRNKGQPDATLDYFIDGIVAFHLVFGSASYIMTKNQAQVILWVRFVLSGEQRWRRGCRLRRASLSRGTVKSAPGSQVGAEVTQSTMDAEAQTGAQK